MHRRRQAFTLVEILMVLAILGISAIVAMPSLVKSIRGNRLRLGARTIVMAGNYARTMAILRNQEMRLTLEKSSDTVTVEPVEREAPPTSTDLGFDAAGASPAPPSDAGPGSSEPPASALPPVRIVRQLDATHIDHVTIGRKKSRDDGENAVVVYQSNGRCTPYEVRIVDDFGSSMLITVDAVASAKVRREGE